MISSPSMGLLEADENQFSNLYELSSINKNKAGRSPRKHSRSTLQLWLACTIFIAHAAVALYLLIVNSYINLAALQLFSWCEVMESFWRFLCGVFTPKFLFIVLNGLILSIFALQHLQPTTESSVGQSVASNNNCTNHEPSRSRQQAEIYNVYQDGAPIGSAQDGKCLEPQRGIEHEEMSSEITLENMEIYDVNVHSKIHDLAMKGEVRASHSLNLSNIGRNAPEVRNEAIEAAFIGVAACATEGQSVTQGVAELSANLQITLAETDKSICSTRIADQENKGKANKKAEKVAASARAISDPLTESLLAEQGTIFAQQGEEIRPLPRSVRPTGKRTTAENERPHGPVETILNHGDTLEAIWMAICERKRNTSPFKYHHHQQASPTLPRNVPLDVVDVHQQRRPRQVLHYKTEPSLPQEELNAKAESFISGFNARIKIQRENSFLEFMEMIGRGVR